MIKRVEVNYRGIFQKNLGKKIGSDIVMIASRMGQKAFSNGRYSDSPERNGIPCKYFAFVSPDLAEEELEAECGAKLEIDEANISVVLDDTMCKGVEPWGWHGIRPINERVVKDGCLLVVSNKKPEELLKFIGKKPYNYRIAILDGDASLAGLWVNKDDMTHERILGGIAAIDPTLISIEAVEAYLLDKDQAETSRRGGARGVRIAEAGGQTSAGQDGYAERRHRMDPRDTRAAQMVRDARGRRGSGGKARLRDGPQRTNEKPGLQARHHQDAAACGAIRSLHQVYALLGRVSGRVLRSDHGRLYDIDYQYCVGCGKCAQVCPVKECIVMVDELQFEDDASPWEHWKKDSNDYIQWVEDKKGKDRVSYPFVTGKGITVTQGEVMPEGKIVPVRKTEEVEV